MRPDVSRGISFELAQRGIPSPSPEPVPNEQLTFDPATFSGPGEERWHTAVTNLQEAGNLVDALQQLLLTTAVYADEPTFSQAASVAYQARALKGQERRIRVLEKEVDAAVLAAARARAAAREAQAAQRAAERRAAQVLEDGNATSAIMESHAKELREKDEEGDKKDDEIRILKAIIQTLSEKPPETRPGTGRYR